MMLNAIKHKQGEHLVINEATIIIMSDILPPLDIVQVSYPTRE